MNPAAYLKTGITPYLLNQDAMALINLLKEEFVPELAKKAVILINAAALHPSMSQYQLSLAHKELGDRFYENKFYGSAAEHYLCGLELNKGLAVKRRVKEIQGMTAEAKTIFCSIDIIEDVLVFPEYKEVLEHAKTRLDKDLEESRRRYVAQFGIEAELQFEERIEAARQECVAEAASEDSVYDPEFEAEVARRLDILGEPYKSEFYREREAEDKTGRDEVLSKKQLDMLRLETMEKSAQWHADQPQKEQENAGI